jgi:hypothetical protein
MRAFCHLALEKEVTPTNRLSVPVTGLATNSESFERVPWGHNERYTDLGIVPTGLFSVAWLRSIDSGQALAPVAIAGTTPNC